MSRITQADVVREAIKQLRKKNGFVTDLYLESKEGCSTMRPGDHVGATCAIGGVEQAIWKLTGEDVTEDRGLVLGAVPWKSVRNALYRGVITKLNAKARKLYPTLPGHHDVESPYEVETLEQLTFVGTELVAKRRTLEVFRAVLADLESK